MQHTLNMYSNLQYNPIKIKDYTILEFYKDSISSANKIGYYILPIEGLAVKTIEEKITSLASQMKPEGYTNSVTLSGRSQIHSYSNYNHRICYIVFYNGDTVPTYPEEPSIGTKLTPAAAFYEWNEIIVHNDGNPTQVSLILTVTSADSPIIFYVNEDMYKVIIPEAGELKISKNGVFLNNHQLTNFYLTNWPQLKAGDNSIRVSKRNVTKVKISYSLKY